MLRTERRLNESLALIQCDFPEVLYPAEDAVLAGLELSQCDVTLLFYDAGEKKPVEEMWVQIFTPRGVLDAWSIFLTPPLMSDVPPVFTLQDMEAVMVQQEGHVKVRVWELEASRDDVDGVLLSILVNTPYNYLDAETIFYAIDEALSLVDPVASSRYTLAWEHDIVPEYGRALLSHMRLSMEAYEATNRAEYLQARARADAFWVQHVLPHKSYVDSTRLIEIPDYILAADRLTEEIEDRQLFAEDWEGQLAAMVPLQALIQKYAPDLDSISCDIANSSDLKKLIRELIPWEKKYPELKVQRALKWIEKHHATEESI